MYGGYLRRLERTKRDWYHARGQEPPNLGFTQPVTRPPPLDMRTYTTTTVLDVFSPPPADTRRRKKLSYWEGEGAGIEPDEFRQSLTSLRHMEVVGPREVEYPRPGRLNACFTPYENDIMSFDAFETVRGELKRRAEALAMEMKRVDNEWARPPVKDWFCLRDERFTREHCRFNQLRRKEQEKKRARTPRREKVTKTYDLRRSIY